MLPSPLPHDPPQVPIRQSVNAMKLIDRYILKTHLGAFALGFFLTTGFLFTQVLRNYLDEFLAKGIEPLTILEVFLLSLGHTLALSIPMAVMVSTLLAFGQLAHDNELTALRSAGMSMTRILAPVLAAAGILCIGMILFNDRVLPESNHRLAGLLVDITRKKPTVDIQPGVFIDQFPGYQMWIGSKSQRTDEIRDVVVNVLHEDRAPDVLVAPRGRLYYQDNGNTLYVELYNGEMHSLPEASPGEQLYRVTHFDTNTVIVPNVGDHLERTERTHRSDREMNIRMLRSRVEEKKAAIQSIRARVHAQASRRLLDKFSLLSPQERAKILAAPVRLRPGKLTRGAEERQAQAVRMELSQVDSYEKQIQSYEVEIHKKYAIPVASIVFVLFGAPLAILSGKSGSTMAASFSIACFTIYYLCLFGGETLAERRLVSPVLAMWIANILFASAGLVLLRRVVTETSVINWKRLDPRTWRSRSRGERDLHHATS